MIKNSIVTANNEAVIIIEKDMIDWLIIHSCDIDLSSIHERKLCYVYQMNKILWERKSLIDYTATAYHQDNNAETIVSVMNL